MRRSMRSADCAVYLRHARAGYYAWRKRGLSNRDRVDRQLKVRIRTVHAESRRTYGSPRVHADLEAQGIACSRKRVERLMREDGLRARVKRRFRITTDSRHAEPIAPNVLARRFSIEETGEPDRIWVTDITYIPTREGWLYLAVVLDLASRRVIGWAMKSRLDRSLAMDALKMALLLRHPDNGVLHHSDRGVQYACEDYRTLLTQHGLIPSMSRKGNCWDNAVAESFFERARVGAD